MLHGNEGHEWKFWTSHRSICEIELQNDTTFVPESAIGIPQISAIPPHLPHRSLKDMQMKIQIIESPNLNTILQNAFLLLLPHLPLFILAHIMHSNPSLIKRDPRRPTSYLISTRQSGTNSPNRTSRLFVISRRPGSFNRSYRIHFLLPQSLPKYTN